jgi:hypothetical protein
VSEIVWEDAIPGETVFKELNDIIRWGAANDPRSLQKAVGPSGIGHPCDRHLTMAIMEEPKLNIQQDPLPSLTGKALHLLFLGADEFKGIVEKWNEHIGYERFITERRVNPRLGFGGSCDIYDTKTKGVIDLKNPGWPALRKYKEADHPGVQYEVQLQEYALGYEEAGYEVRYVAIWALPRGGLLKDAWWWGAPYSPEIAHAANLRYDELALVADELDLEHHPERYRLIPATPYFCDHCDYRVDEPVAGAHCLGEEKTDD